MSLVCGGASPSIRESRVSRSITQHRCLVCGGASPSIYDAAIVSTTSSQNHAQVSTTSSAPPSQYRLITNTLQPPVQGVHQTVQTAAGEASLSAGQGSGGGG